MAIEIKGTIPALEFNVNGQIERIEFTGARVVTFWRMTREALGWSKLPLDEISKRVQEIVDASKSGKPLAFDVDEDRVISAVESILPASLHGLRYQQALEAFREALTITLSEMFFEQDDTVKKK